MTLLCREVWPKWPHVLPFSLILTYLQVGLILLPRKRFKLLMLIRSSWGLSKAEISSRQQIVKSGRKDIFFLYCVASTRVSEYDLVSSIPACFLESPNGCHHKLTTNIPLCLAISAYAFTESWTHHLIPSATFLFLPRSRRSYSPGEIHGKVNRNWVIILSFKHIRKKT